MACDVVSPGDQAPKHHVTLCDGDTSIGFVLLNKQGKRDETAFNRYPLKPSAIKFQQGESKYEDNESPYSAMVQDDWSGGRGSRKFEDDRSRYLDGNNIDTTNEGAVVLGPRAFYADGFSNIYADQTGFGQPTDYRTVDLKDTERYVAVSFVVPSDVTQIAHIRIWAKRFGSSNALNVYLYNDVAGEPGTIQRSGNVSLPNGGTLGSDSDFIDVSFSAFTATPGNTMWVVVTQTGAPDALNYTQLLTHSDDNNQALKSSDGNTWVAWNDAFHFMLAGDLSSFTPRFYEYKGQLYFARDFDDGPSDSDVWMQGWRGAADSNAGAMNKLKDATQTGVFWQNLVNQDRAGVIRMVKGDATDENKDWRFVTGSTNGELTVHENWYIEHDQFDDYIVTGVDRFQQITQPGSLSGHIKTVAVANGQVWFGFGKQDEIWRHREYNSSGVWTADGTNNSWVQERHEAAHIITQRDPIKGDMLWLANDENKYRPQVFGVQAPEDWSTNNDSMSQIILDNFTDDWDEQSVTNVNRTHDAAQRRITFEIIQGQITSVSANSDGADYQVGDILTIEEWAEEPDNYLTNAGRNATVRVATIGAGGSVDSVDTLSGDNFDYTTGVKTTSGGSGDGNATVTINSTTSHGTGVIGSEVVDFNLAYTGKILMQWQTDIDLNVGDLQLMFDDDENLTDPQLAIDLHSSKAGEWKFATLDFDPDNFTNLHKIISMGMQLANTKQTFNLTLGQQMIAYALGAPVEVGDDGDNVTGLTIYGDEENVWVFTETGFGEIRNNLFVPAPINELKSVRNPINGSAHTVNDVYLYFNLKEGVERYYRQNLEDIGPNKDAGLGDKRGPISAMVSYPGAVIVGTNPRLGYDNLITKRKSSILMGKGRAWHPLYTTRRNEEIRSMFVQSVVGEDHERLWFGNGEYILWMPLAFSTDDLATETLYDYAHEGDITTGWIYTGKPDLTKVFRSVTVFAENISAGNQEIDVWYRKNDETTWTEVGTITSGPAEELDLVSGAFVSAKRIQLKFRLRTDAVKTSPIMQAWVLKFFTKEPLKYGYQWITLLTEGDLSINLQGDEEKTWGTYPNVGAALNKFDQWVSDLTPLTMNSAFSPMNAKSVVARAAPVQSDRVLPDEQIEAHVVQITVEEL